MSYAVDTIWETLMQLLFVKLCMLRDHKIAHYILKCKISKKIKKQMKRTQVNILYLFQKQFYIHIAIFLTKLAIENYTYYLLLQFN